MRINRYTVVLYPISVVLLLVLGYSMWLLLRWLALNVVYLHYYLERSTYSLLEGAYLITMLLVCFIAAFPVARPISAHLASRKT